MKKRKEPTKPAGKQRAKHYEKPLKIYGTFDQAMKAIVSEPSVSYQTKK